MTRLERLGRWCATHGWLVVLLWVTVLIGVTGGAVALGSATADDFGVPGAESAVALDLLHDRFPASAGVEGKLVLVVDSGDLLSPARARAVQDTAARLARLPGVRSVAPPGSTTVDRLSPDRRIGVLGFTLDKAAGQVTPDDVERVLHAAAPARAAGLRTEVGGAVAMAASKPESGGAELVGVAAAILILLIAFGSVVAMGLPLVMALVGLGIGLGTLTMASRLFEVPGLAPSLATMIGLGVGIDYALFIVTRHRAQLAEGMEVLTSIGRATATSGGAVVFAGVTVMIAICGLAIAGVPILSALGYATSLVVALAVLAAITLLPALLGLLGERIDRLRVPRFSQPAAHGASGRWRAWSQGVARHPWAWASASLVLIAVLAAPALSLQLGQPDGGTSPPATTERRAYDLLAHGFGPGSNGPLLLAIDLDTPARPTPGYRAGGGQPAAVDPRATDPRLTALSTALRRVPGVASVAPPVVGPDGRAVVLTVIPTTSPQDPVTAQLVERLRSQVLPTVTPAGARVHVGGQTATFIDLASRTSDRLPWFVAGVVLLSCLLLALVFRSIVIPLQAAVMNVLSIGAALGVVVTVFQHGIGLGLLGLQEPVPIISFVPLMLFAILFGLSMDYEVFLLSSIREAWLSGADNREAVTAGLTRSGRVITSAALIMIAVFGSFMFSDDPMLKVFGLGLTVAVALDATVIRCVLVPAVMVLCGRANWWLPAGLERALPRLELDEAHTPDGRAALTSEVG